MAGGNKIMRGKPIFCFVAVAMTGFAIAGVIIVAQVVSAAERAFPKADAKAEEGKDNKSAIAVDVVIEDVDLSAKTITARATNYVIPPHGNVGGAVFMMGTTDSHKEKVTKFVRLPVMPEGDITNKKVKVGLHAILRLAMMRRGSLVVVGIEELSGPEKVGVQWLDATGTGTGK
jgi:hypothetical protein